MRCFPGGSSSCTSVPRRSGGCACRSACHPSSCRVLTSIVRRGCFVARRPCCCGVLVGFYTGLPSCSSRGAGFPGGSCSMTSRPSSSGRVTCCCTSVIRRGCILRCVIRSCCILRSVVCRCGCNTR
jgi:hypothetical protein